MKYNKHFVIKTISKFGSTCSCKKIHLTTVNQLAEGLMFFAFALAFIAFCAIIAVLIGTSKGDSVVRTRNILTATVGLFLPSGMFS